jgi:hypothetical protein
VHAASRARKANAAKKGDPGKLPITKTYQLDTVHYAGDVVVQDGSTYQALRDTGRAPPHSDDWICLASAGRDGIDAITPTVCGSFDATARYKKLDIVEFDKSSFIALDDDPGLPGNGSSWQLIAGHGMRGEKGLPGPRGERGTKGEKGNPSATIRCWEIDRRSYQARPVMSDGTVGPSLELRALFEQYHAEAGG